MIARIRLNYDGKWWPRRMASAGPNIAAGRGASPGAGAAVQDPATAGDPGGGLLEARTYDEGMREGVKARLHKHPISPYQRVGCDEFARGFRAGYFASRAAAARTASTRGQASS